MVPLDERILEILDEEWWATPRQIARKVSLYCSRARVRERCKYLTYAELIEPVSPEGMHYGLTTTGKRYLDGKLDVRHQPHPSPRRVL
jgi:hypothetical protein